MLRAAICKQFCWHMPAPANPLKLRVELLIFLFLIIILQSFRPFGELQVVTLSFKEAPLQKVFAEIRKQTGYSFAYFETDLAKAKPVNINVSNSRLQDALNTIFKDQPLSYTIIEKVVVVKQRDEKKISLGQSSLQVLQDGIDIKGRVFNEREDPVAGVSVQVKGTNMGTATNGEGEFELKKVNAQATLVLTAVNIERKEASINGQRNLEIKVLGRSGKLDEVQVIAYGKTSQRFNVGNVTSVKAEDIEKQPVTNPLLALQGRVPGLIVIQETGVNGGGVKVRIQGDNSIRNGNNPLIVVDGVPYPTELPFFSYSERLIGNQGLGSPLSFINLNDIESIDVLKDADATSIYGSRAANGAILITTKKGRSGKMQINLNLQHGWSKVTRKMDMLNTRQYLDMRYEALKNAGQIPTDRATGVRAPFVFAPDLTLWDTARYTDWQEELIGATARFSNFHFSVSGGAPTASYLVGMTFNRNTDVFPGDHALKSGTLHFNLNTASLNQKFKLQLSGAYTVSDNSLPGVDLTAAAIRLVPVAPPMLLADSVNWARDPAGNDTWDNPIGLTYYRRYTNLAHTLYSNILIGYTLLPGLEIRAQLGYTNIKSESKAVIPLGAIFPRLRAFSTREAIFNNSIVETLIAEPQINYSKSVGNLKIDALLGSTWQQNAIQSIILNGSGYATDLLMDGISGAASVFSTMDKKSYRYNALFTRISLAWKNKYLLSVNGRRDGSSRFGDKRRFHNFGSLGAGWIFSEEQVIKKALPFLSFGKLRSSYGTTGNDQISDYSFLSRYANILPGVLYQGVSGMGVSNLFNPYLQWEENRKWQAGIDLGFWRDRLLISVTYSRNRSSNQLIEYVLPAVTGFSFVNDNFPATLQNISWEMMLNAVVLKNTKFKWSSNVNLTIPRNKVVAFPGIEQSSYASPLLGIVVGKPKGAMPVSSFSGVDPATGQYLGKDKFGNPVRDGALDQYINTAPVYYGGWQNAIVFKAVQFDFLFQFVRQWGTRQFDYWNGEQIPGNMRRGFGNQSVSVLNRWQKPGDDALVAPYSSAVGNLGILPLTDGYYTLDASFIRLKNIALSWQLPTTSLKKIGLLNGRVYTQVQNLLTITRFSGLDPENQSATSLPPLRTWTVGLQLGF